MMNARRDVGFFDVILLFVIAAAWGCSKQPPPPTIEVRIAAAASLKPVLPDLIGAYAKSHPKVTLTPTYGASGNFHSQLVSGAPFDVFLSADTVYPGKLHEAGLTHSPPQQYAEGVLVIWAKKSSGLDVGSLAVLAGDRVKKVAIANPKHAPYGRAAEAALKAAGVYDAVQPKLVLGESVEQASTFLMTDAAEIGLIPKSQALSKAMREVGESMNVPDGLYEPIRHAAVVMKSAGDVAAANAFVDWLTGPEAQRVLGEAGLTLGK